MRSVGRSKIRGSIPTSSLFSVAFILIATVFMTASATSYELLETSPPDTFDTYTGVEYGYGTVFQTDSTYNNLYVTDEENAQGVVDDRDQITWWLKQGKPTDFHGGQGVQATTTENGKVVFEDVDIQPNMNYTVFATEDDASYATTYAKAIGMDTPLETPRFTVMGGLYGDGNNVMDKSNAYMTDTMTPYNASDTNITLVKETVEDTYYLYDTFTQDTVDVTDVVNVAEGMMYDNESVVQHSDYAEAFITLHDVAVISTLDINVSYDTNSSGVEARAIGYDENGTNVTYNETVETNFSTSKTSFNTTPINDALGNENITDVKVVFKTTENSSEANFAIQDIAVAGNMEQPVFTVGGFIDSATSIGEMVGNTIKNVVATIIDTIVGLFTGGVA